MPAKKKLPRQWAVGDKASVRYIKESHSAMNRFNEICDTGFITKVSPDKVEFKSTAPRTDGFMGMVYTFKRKGDRWVEVKKDCYTLE